MAYVIVFPDQESFGRGLALRRRTEPSVVVLHPPGFCQELLPPSLLVTGGLGNLLAEMETQGIQSSGTFPYEYLNREIPEAPPPDPVWKEILRGFGVNRVRLSVTDPRRLRVEATSERWPATLIPIMARLIRGGTFLPDGPILAFEEEHRLIAFSPEGMVISRADHLLDLWIMVRTAVDLVCLAYQKRLSLEPETESRHGISAIEIFKRLPGTDCGMCEHYSCMEFATSLLLGRCRLDQCSPLQNRGDRRSLESLDWLASIMGIMPWQGPRDNIGRS